jgi:hypothetical protein
MSLNLFILVLTVIAAFVGVAGTLMMANGYYPGGVLSFFASLPELLVGVFRRQHTKRLEIAQKLADKEDRTMTLMGLCLVFLGFLLQLIAATLAFLGTLTDTSAK